MLIIEIYVNHQLVGKETAVRVAGGTRPNDMNTYELSDGTHIFHRYGDGAARLAEQMSAHLAETKGL
jgi:hypothetical protein